MKITFSAKSILFAVLSLSFASISCNNEEGSSSATPCNSSAAFKERLTTSDKIRTEDMILFRSKLHDAAHVVEKGDKQKYENMLLEASTAYLDFNNSNATYTNSGGFSFYSPSSLPVISTWQRQLTATSTSVNTASTLAQNLFGATHRYSEFKFYVEDSNANTTGSGNIDPLDLDNPLETPLGENILTTCFPLPNGDVVILFDEI